LGDYYPASPGIQTVDKESPELNCCWNALVSETDGSPLGLARCRRLPIALTPTLFLLGDAEQTAQLLGMFGRLDFELKAFPTADYTSAAAAVQTTLVLGEGEA
jgi:hypothetical protein